MVAVVSAVVSAGCASSSARRSARPPGAVTTTGAATTSVPPASTTAATVTPTSAVPTSTVPTSTTSTTVAATAPIAPSFASSVATVTAADLPSSYRAGCPVGPAQLRAVRLSYWGFDNRPHTGTVVVNAAVVHPVVTVFAQLFAQRFPIRRMQPVDAFGGSDPASMAADNTSGFNCRDAVASGPPRWSAHAYGEAIDVNTVENPYVQGADVQPAAGSAFLDRTAHRPGTAYSGGVLVSAFASVGWQWGGRWSDPDYQHFSATGG